MGYAAFYGPFDGLAGKQAVDEAGGKAVAAADAVADFDVALRDADDLVLVVGDSSPSVAAGTVRRAQGAGDELEIRIGRSHFAQHLFVTGDGQLGEVLADAFDFDAEHGGKIFFVAQQQIDLANQLAVHFLGTSFAADGFPEGIAEVEVVGDGSAVRTGRVHGFNGDLGGGGGECGEDAAGVQPFRAILVAEDRRPIEVACLDLADSGVAAV